MSSYELISLVLHDISIYCIVRIKTWIYNETHEPSIYNYNVLNLQIDSQIITKIINHNLSYNLTLNCINDVLSG